MEEEITQKKNIVLKVNADLEDVKNIVNKKKTSLFGTVFNRPDDDDIDVSSIDVFYESYWIIGGYYTGEYYRKNNYEYAVDPDVKEVLIGKGTFPVRSSSGAWSKLKDRIKVGEKENLLDIPVEEHLEIDVEDEVVLNGNGKEIKFKYKIDSKNIENFPEDVLKANQSKVRSSEITQEQAIGIFMKLLREDMERQVRVVKEKIVIDRLEQVFVPIFEARCVDDNNKAQILRIDALDLKIL